MRLEPLDQQLLRVLRAEPGGRPVPASELATVVDVAHLTLVDELERLRSLGWLEVTADGCVRLTPQGRRAADRWQPDNATISGDGARGGAARSSGARGGAARSSGARGGAARSSGRPGRPLARPSRDRDGHDVLPLDGQHANRLVATLLAATAALLAIGLEVPALALIPGAYLVYLWVFRAPE